MTDNDVVLDFDELWNEMEAEKRRPIDELRREYDMKPTHWKEWCLANRPDVDAMEQYRIRAEETKEARIQKEVSECCKPITRFDPKRGKLYQVKSRRCKRYEHCDICRKWRQDEELELMSNLVGKVQYVEVDDNERANLVRKYGSDRVRCVPMDGDRVGIIIDTKDEIGQELTFNDCRKLSRHAIPTDNRRISGKLGTVTQVVSKKEEVLDWDELEKELNDPEIEVELREMDISYDSEDENAPKNVRELQEIVEEEVDVNRSPESEEELKEALDKCELKTQEICNRYNMSFSFFSKRLVTLRMSEVDWNWEKFKQKE